MANRIMEINPRPSEVLELIDRMQKNRVDGPYTLISDDVDPVIIDDLKGPFSEADAVENVAKLLQIAEVEVRFLTEEQFNELNHVASHEVSKAQLPYVVWLPQLKAYRAFGLASDLMRICLVEIIESTKKKRGKQMRKFRRTCSRDGCGKMVTTETRLAGNVVYLCASCNILKRPSPGDRRTALKASRKRQRQARKKNRKR